jgi:hypothetical protein
MATTSSRLRGRESLFAMTHRINRAHRQFKKAVQHGRASDHDYRWSLQARSFSLQGCRLIDLPLRATFSPAHPLARRDVPLARARAFKFSPLCPKGSSQTVLHCANKFRRLLLSIPLEGPLERLPLRPSNEGMQILYTSLWRSGRGCPLLRASSDHRYIVGALRARRAPGRSSLTLHLQSLTP